MNQLTPAQQRAVGILDRDCVVTAGAGSGKTRVLVERYLSVLDQYHHEAAVLEQVVAITFTEKAATEMRQRIREGIVERRRRARLASKEEEAERWNTLLFQMEHANILTIHSLCVRLLRDFPVEAGIDPDFTVLDEAEARWLLREAVEEAIASVFEKEEGGNHLEWFLMARGKEDVIQQLMQAVNRIAGYGWTGAELARRTREHVTRTAERLHVEQRVEEASLHDLGEALLKIRGAKLKRLAAFQEAWPSLEQALASCNTLEERREVLAQLLQLLKGNWGRKEEVTVPRNQMRETVESLLQKVDGCLTLEGEREATETLFPLFSHISKRYRELKAKQGALDFNDLELYACRLLEQHSTLRDQLEGRIRFLMVDEYQDTNDLQKRLIDLLRSEKGGNLFVVGDPKQSIYRFRGANVAVFGQTMAEITADHGARVELVDNFRSHPALISFVNVFFGRLMPAVGAGHEYQEAIPRREGSEETPCVEYLALPREDLQGGNHPQEIEAQQIARRIADLIASGTKPGEIAVLFRAMTHIKLYEQALARQKIPFYVVKGRGFYERQEVVDVLNFLRYLADPSNQLALVGVLRSPFCGLSDETLLTLAEATSWSGEIQSWRERAELPAAEERKLVDFAHLVQRARYWAGRVSVAELIRLLLEESGYRHVVWATPSGKQAQANLQKLTHLAAARQGEEALFLEPFLQRIDLLIADDHVHETEAAVEAEESDSVRLMTIHQAKGLEFPVVIVPHLSRRERRIATDLVVDPEAGLTVCLFNENGERKKTFRWLETGKREQTLEREESLRLFYVACTRAERYLILSGDPEEWKREKSKGEGVSASWNDWLNEVLDPSRIDWEAGRWSIPEEGLDLHVLRYNPIHSPAYKEEECLLDQWLEGKLRPKESIAVETRLQRPRGFTEKDRIPVSVTELMLLTNCARKYFYQRIAGLPSLKFDGEGIGEQEEVCRDEEQAVLEPTRIGDLVHLFIERSTPEIDEEDVKTLLQRVIGESGIPSHLQPLVLERVRPLIVHYLRSRYHRQVVREKRTEAYFYQPLGGLKVEGVIDRLHCTSSGNWEIVDYKTNDVTSAQIADVAAEYLPQLQLYVLAARHQWGITPERATLFFLRPNQEVTFSVTSAWLEEAEEMVEQCTKLLLGEQSIASFPPRPGKRCAYCDYRIICKAAPSDSTVTGPF